MRTYLQNLYGGGFGPLPNTSPYGAPSNTYADINDPAGAAGAVVDWVVVEVRQASNYGIIAESQSLLLKDDGTIVTPTGAVPTFAAQTGTVRVVIKHRNHLAVMSNDLLDFQTAVSYDFTTALTKAANDFGDPAQMKTEYGVWVMIGGDINLDNSVETLDQNLFHTSLGTIDFPEYFNADINLDANVDILDENILFPNFLTGYYSTITNY